MRRPVSSDAAAGPAVVVPQTSFLGDVVLTTPLLSAVRGLGGLVRVARRLRRERFDLAVVPHRSLRTALVVAAAGVPRRIGFRESRGAALFHQRVARDRRLHDVERNLALVRALGNGAGVPRLHVPVDPAAAARAASLLPPGAAPLVAI